MSVRAYRVKEIVWGDESFNLWHDKEIYEYLAKSGYLSQLNDDGCGFIDLSIEAVKEMLKITENEFAKKRLEEDIECAERKEEDYILYNCF
jgi:hypothetical protein